MAGSYTGISRRRVLAIMRKDLLEIGTNSQFWVPTLIVPLILMGILPLVLVTVGTRYSIPMNGVDTALKLVEKLPHALKTELKGLGANSTFIYLFVNYFFAPMFLIIPTMTTSIIGASAFAGEKERRTLESLLHTPTTDLELMVGKMLSAFVPALILSFISFLVYGIVVNAGGWAIFHRLIFPTPTWIALLIWVAPAFALLSLGLTVVVSSKARGFQEAQQISAIVVVPILGMMLSQLAGLTLLSVPLAIGVGLAIYSIAVAVIIWGARSFSRARAVLGIR